MKLIITLLPETNCGNAEGWSVQDATIEQVEAIRAFIQATLRQSFEKTTEPEQSTLGERIKSKLGKRTQRQFAEECGITEVSMSRYISGEIVPRATNLAKIAEALGVSCDYLMGKEK